MSNPKSDKIEFEYMPLSALKKYPRNPKDHDLGTIQGAIKSDVGFASPIIIDLTTGYVGAGHGRIDALLQMYYDNPKKPPKRIMIDDNGDWLVPVNKLAFEDETQLQQFIIMDNRISELGGWDEPMLADVLVELAGAGDGLLDVTGYDGDDLDDLLRDLNPIKKGEHANDPYEEYMGLPEYVNEDKRPMKSLIVHFTSQADIDKFSELVGQKITHKTESIYYPPKPIQNRKNKGYINE